MSGLLADQAKFSAQPRLEGVNDRPAFACEDVERRRPGATRRPRSGRRSMATSRGWKSDARAVAESVLLRRETNRDVRVGSIASFWTLADDFRTTPGNGHRQGGRHISKVPISDIPSLG